MIRMNDVRPVPPSHLRRVHPSDRGDRHDALMTIR